MLKIYDKNDILLEEYDANVGYTIEDKHFVRHVPAQPFIQEQGHYEVIAEYPNGGKDVKWVVDVPGQEFCEEHDEYEDCLRFVELTQIELMENRIFDLTRHLEATDYIGNKIIEGDATIEDYADLIAQRKEWRREIRQLEELIKNSEEK